MNRIGVAICVPLASLVLVLYTAPAWFLDRLSGGRLDTSWATYTADFQHGGLPLFIGLEVALLAMLADAAIRGRWSRRRRRISIGLNLTLACLVLTLAVNGNMFPSDRVDQIARSVLAMVALFYVPLVGGANLQRDGPHRPGRHQGGLIPVCFAPTFVLRLPWKHEGPHTPIC